MSQQSFLEWLRSRSPEVPEPFLPYLLEEKETAAGVDSRSLMEMGMARLGTALEEEGRRAAFDLLAADALFTYACEEAARAPDVQLEVEGLLRLLGGRFD
jgi:hypothetical protein